MADEVGGGDRCLVNTRKLEIRREARSRHPENQRPQPHDDHVLLATLGSPQLQYEAITLLRKELFRVQTCFYCNVLLGTLANFIQLTNFKMVYQTCMIMFNNCFMGTTTAF